MVANGLNGRGEDGFARRHGFEPGILEAYLRTALSAGDGPMTLEPVSGGQSNPTFFVTLGARRLVLRKKPNGVLLASAHAVDREYDVLKALAGSGVPVPPVLLYEARDDIVGTPFYLMERVNGRIFHDSSLPGASSGDRAAMYEDAARVLATLHGVDYAANGLGRYGKAGGYYGRQVRRWSGQWTQSKTRDLPEVEDLQAWLAAHIPDDDATTIVHGDFRIGNLIFHPSEPKVVAVLDWELSTLGDPLADLAHTLIFTWHVGPDEYGGLLGTAFGALGLPDGSAFAEHYYRHSTSRRRIAPFHLAFALFRNAVIFEGIAARAQGGSAAADDAAKVGRLAPVFADRALAIIRSVSPGGGGD